MSWLRQTVKNSVNQLSGQLKDILTENTDDVVDTATELKTLKDKLNDQERHNEFLKNECKRLNEELNESIVKSEALEIQLENLSISNRNQIAEKDSVIFDLRKQITTLQSMQQEQQTHSNDPNYFEEIMPSSELNDYIRLQKEIKRLQEENSHLHDENHKLLKQQTTFATPASTANTFKEIKINDDNDSNILIDDFEEINDPNNGSGSNSSMNKQAINLLKQKIENYEKEIESLKLRLKIDNDKHQEEIISIQNTYKEKLQQTYEAHRREIEKLNKEKDDLASWKDGWNAIEDDDVIRTSTITTISSSSPDNDEKVQQLTNEIDKLRKDIEKSELEIEESSKIIDNLNIELKKLQESSRKEVLQKNELLNELKLAKEKSEKLNELITKCDYLDHCLFKEKELNRLNEEKLNNLTAENEKLLSTIQDNETKFEELKSLSQQEAKVEGASTEVIEELNETIKNLKLNETKLKYNYENELTTLSKELELIREENLNLNRNLNEKEKDKTQYLTIIEEKNKECLNLQTDLNSVQDTLSDLKIRLEKAEENNSKLNELTDKDAEINLLQQTQMQQEQALNELNLAYNALQVERTQLYYYLNQKSDESLNYYNEIQRLNETIMNLNQELVKIKEEYVNLENELNLENKLVDDLNNETENLKLELQQQQQKVQKQQQQLEQEILEHKIEKADASIETEKELRNEFKHELELKLKLIDEKNLEIDQLKFEIKNLNDNYSKLNEKLSNSQFDLKRTTSERDQALMNLRERELDLRRLSEQANEQITKLNKELERLREHLVEMSDSYTKEAIQAENREKELRLLLTQAEENISNQNTNIVNTSKEMQKRNHELTYENEDLKAEKQRLITQLKQIEDSYQNQIKVTKNLELVLERLQKDKDSQHNNEILKYQDTIKQNAVTIHNYQKDIANYQVQINELTEVVGAASRLNEQLEKKDETISYLQQQIQTKENAILLLEAKINEVQKVNENYIEKDIIKNLVIGYLKVNTNERKQVLKLIGSMLNFQPHDYEQIEQSSLSSKWLSSMFSSGQASGTSSKSPSPSKTDALNKSFTELLIQYVDRESKPKPRVSLDLASNSSKQSNTGLLIGTTNKKTDNPLFYPVPPTPSSQQSQQPAIFNPATQTTSTLSNRGYSNPNSQFSSGISTGQTDYPGLQTPNLSNRFTPTNLSSTPFSGTSTQQTLSNNNNSFLEDALN